MSTILSSVISYRGKGASHRVLPFVWKTDQKFSANATALLIIFLKTNRVFHQGANWYLCDDANGSDILIIQAKTKRGIYLLKVFLFSGKKF